MENQYLIPGEEILMQSDDKTITLTNFRVRYYNSSMGDAGLVSMHLDKLSAIQMSYVSHPGLLVLGIVVALGGAYCGFSHQTQAYMPIGIIAGLVLILFYWLTRRHYVSIASDSGVKISFGATRMKNEILMNFLNGIEKAKHDFILKK